MINRILLTDFLKKAIISNGYLSPEELYINHNEDLVSEGLFDKSATLEVLKNQTAVTLIQKLQDGSQVLVTGNIVIS